MLDEREFVSQDKMIEELNDSSIQVRLIPRAFIQDGGSGSIEEVSISEAYCRLKANQFAKSVMEDVKRK